MAGMRGPYASIGVDVGGTKIESVMVDDSGAVIGHMRGPSRQGACAVIEDICGSVRNLLDAVTLPVSLAPASIAIGVGVPGRVDTATGTVEEAVNLGIDHLRLGPSIEGRLGSSVFVDNDVNMAAIGAVARTRDKVRDAVFINFGTGLAAGVIHDGMLVRGSSGVIGEIGHVPVCSDGVVCKCGQVGCLETVASGSAISRLWPTAGGYAMRDLLDHVDGGDAHAVQVLRTVVSGVITAVLMVVTTLDPPVVLLGGGMLKAGARLHDAIIRELDRRELVSDFLKQVRVGERIRFVPGNEPIGAFGAAIAARSTFTDASAHDYRLSR